VDHPVFSSIKYLYEDGQRVRNMQEIYQMSAYHCTKSQCGFWYIKMVTYSVNSHNVNHKYTNVTFTFFYVKSSKCFDLS